MPRPTIKSRVDTLLGKNACGNRCPAANSVVLPATLGMSFCFEPWAFRLCMAQSFTSDWGLRLRRLRLQTSGPSLVHGMLRRLRLKVLVDGLLRLSCCHGLLMGLLRSCNHIMLTYSPQEVSFSESSLLALQPETESKECRTYSNETSACYALLLETNTSTRNPQPCQLWLGILKGFRKRDSVGLQASCGRLIDGALTSSLRLRRHGGGTWLAILRT